jgi:hypothetical protein
MKASVPVDDGWELSRLCWLCGGTLLRLALRSHTIQFGSDVGDLRGIRWVLCPSTYFVETILHFDFEIHVCCYACDHFWG